MPSAALVDLALLAAGVVFLYLGAEALVAGAGRLALGLGLRAATVGVTVIAFATTAPELFVAMIGALGVSTDIGLGAIVGSNIANIGLVLGVAAMIRPLTVSEVVFRRHVPFMVLAAALLYVLGYDGYLGPIEGLVLLAVLAVFTGYVLIRARQTHAAAVARGDLERVPDPAARDVVLVIGGLIGLLLGSRWLIAGGQSLLAEAGFSDVFIGLTVLAIGTSLPELAASVLGAIRDEAAFSVGNVVGSNIYNVLAVLGLLALVVPIRVPPSVIAFEFPALIAFTVAVVALMYRGRCLSRIDGAILVVGYAAFIVALLP